MLCTRYQRRHCILLSDSDSTVEYCVEKSYFNFSDLDYGMRELIANIDPSFPTCDILFSKHLFSMGFHLYCERKHTVVVTNVDITENDSLFWMVVHIVYVNRSWHLVLRKLTTQFIPHFNIYIYIYISM